MGSAGVATLVGAPGSAVNYGAAAIIFIGAFFWATGSVYMTTADMPSNPIMATALQMTIGGSLLLIAGLATREPSSLDFARVSGASLFGWLWLIGPGALLGFSAFSYALSKLPMTTVAPYAYINPVVTVALGGILGDQPLTLGLLAGGAAVVGAVAVTLVKPRQTAVMGSAPEAGAEIA